MDDHSFSRDWVLAIGSLLLTFPAAAAIRASLARFSGNRRVPWLAPTAPALSKLVHIVGLSVFAEVAPLPPRFSTWLENAVYVCAVLIGLGILRRAALAAIDWSASRSTQSHVLLQGFVPLLQNLVTLFVFFSGAIMVMKRFNYDVMSLLTALGVGSLAIGLAAKDTLSNMISGFTLIIDRNLKPGDRINLGGTVGDVAEIGLRSTRLNTGDGNVLIVPNAELVNTKILNLSLSSRERSVSTTVRVPYSVPFGRVKSLCLEVISRTEKASASKGRWVNLTSLAEGYQLVTIGFWLREMDDAGAVISEFNERLLARFQQERIPLHASGAASSASGETND